jgi:hypothetical protein
VSFSRTSLEHKTEISLATMVYNLKRMFNVLGGIRLRAALAA